MFTDMVGYSALSQRNEELALELLHEHRELLRAVFPRHQGQEIKSTGDGFLVEFASALAAVRCAVEIQQLMRKRNEARSAERRVLIRIGIHLGDVVRRENDVFGDGVNIAARIEPLAEPGGICVSRAVYEQIENKVAHSLVQLSRPALKNIQATVEVYRLLLDEPRGSRPSPAATTRSRWPLVVVGLALVVISVLAIPKLRSPTTSELVTTNTSPATVAAQATLTNRLAPLKIEFKVLHDFGPTNSEGVNGWGPVTLSKDGYLYGCTVNLGPGGGGAIYRIRTNGADPALLHAFNRVKDGAEPTGGVIEGSDGLLYGTTFRGGTQNSGTIFRMARDGGGFQVLHHFASTNDCRHPQAELLEAKDGWIYGTATGGGGFGMGGVFKFNKDGSGYGTVTGFYRGLPDDPRQPVGGLIQAADGNFYGTTKSGGEKNNGTLFRLEESGRLIVLKSLGLVGGGAVQPEGTLIFAGDGLLYGTTTLGGTAGAGTIFRSAPDGSNFAIVYSFGTKVDEARQPSAGLVAGGDGWLLGTSFAGGAANFGTVFRVEKDGSGYQTLHEFVAGSGDGMRSRSVLTPAAPGVFYSATLSGGRNGYGVVYQLAIPEVIRAATDAGDPAKR